MLFHFYHRICLPVAFCLLVLFASPMLAGATELTPEQAKDYIGQTKELTILDVRNPNEFVTGHYPNALNIPVAELEQRVAEVPAGKPVLIHCAKGIRAKRAYDVMKAQRPEMEVMYIKGSPQF